MLTWPGQPYEGSCCIFQLTDSLAFSSGCCWHSAQPPGISHCSVWPFPSFCIFHTWLMTVTLPFWFFPGSASLINHLHTNPCLRDCFWGTQPKTTSIGLWAVWMIANQVVKRIYEHCIRKRDGECVGEGTFLYSQPHQRTWDILNVLNLDWKTLCPKYHRVTRTWGLSEHLPHRRKGSSEGWNSLLEGMSSSATQIFYLPI